MIFKSFGLNFKDLLKQNFILLYGENLSLISEIETKITLEAKNNLNLSIKRYQEEYLLQNPEVFDQLINSDSLFDEKELTIIGKSTDKILDMLNENSAKINEKKLVFLSDSLTKKSKLRSLAESSMNFACIACYTDTQEQLQAILAQKLKDNKVVVSREFVSSIFEINSLNRQDINDAIDKIQLIKKSSELNEETLKDIFHSSTESDNFEIINFCLLGDKKNINKTLVNIYAQGINFNEILSVLKYKVNKLIEILESNTNNTNIGQLVDAYKPPIFWKEKNIVKEQLKRWSKLELDRLMDIIFETETSCKKNYEISTTILQQFIVSTSSKACLENRFF
jgi:DNA polymerase III subunit delta